MDKHDLKEAGLKVTQPRTAVLKVLETADEHHLNAEEIYRILRDSDYSIGLATIYRVLTQFESAGLVIRHQFEGGQAVFELDNGEHHDHMVCLKTGKIVEFHDDIIEKRQKEIAEEHGFELADHCLILYGEFKAKS